MTYTKAEATSQLGMGKDVTNMDIKKTKKGNKYIFNGIESIDAANKDLADKGKDISDQYFVTEEDFYCKHGTDNCMICD